MNEIILSKRFNQSTVEPNVRRSSRSTVAVYCRQSSATNYFTGINVVKLILELYVSSNFKIHTYFTVLFYFSNRNRSSSCWQKYFSSLWSPKRVSTVRMRCYRLAFSATFVLSGQLYVVSLFSCACELHDVCKITM